MSFPGWVVTATIILIILAITFGIGWWIRNRSDTAPKSPTKYSAPLVWGNPIPGPNPDKNSCQLYQFPTAVVNIDGVFTAVPGTPTFDPNILDNLTGELLHPQCVDTDQIIARQVQHTCTGPFGVADRATSRCFLLRGGTTGIGGSEVYYTNSQCLNIPPCAGQLSLVSLNYQAPKVPDIFCLQNDNNVTMSMEPCNPQNPNQLFRVTRTNPGQNPNSLQPGQGQNGLLAQILNRNTGLCVMPGTGTSSTIFDPNYLTPVDGNCVGTPVTVQGTNIIQGACTGGEFPGYVWGFLPSVLYCSLTGGCTGNEALTVPPQIVYVDNLDFSRIGPTGYAGLTGASALVQFLIDNNAQSLFYGGGGNGVILRNLALNLASCPDRATTAQYLNLTTYNTLIAEEVCLAEGTLGTQSCVSL